MKNEFKVTKSKEQTVYTLESATGGSTSVGSIASTDSTLGGMQRRNPPGDNILAQEKKETPKPRNFVAKNAKMGGAGQHKDKKKAEKQGDVKHKNKDMDMAEGKDDKIAQLKKDHDTAVHWSKNETSPQKREAARQKAEKIKRHLDTQYKQGVAEGVAETLPIDDAVKVLRQYGADHFKTTSNELRFYKQGRPLSVDLIWGNEGERRVNLSQLNSATRQLKGQGVAEGFPKDPNAPKLVRDRKTGKQYDPNKEFEKKMNSPEVMAQMKRMAQKEGVAEDHEIQMASSELQSIAKNAVNLLSLVRKYSEQEGLDAWQQSKITKAADYLNSVLQSINGEQSNMESDAYMESLQNMLERSVSQAQHNLMVGVAHNPQFAQKVKVKQKVGQEFARADQGHDISKLPIRVPKKK